MQPHANRGWRGVGVLAIVVLTVAALPADSRAGADSVPGPLGATEPTSRSRDFPPTVRPLPRNAAADYQLGGASRVPPGVTVVARDSSAQPVGEYAICYVNAFQTQPGRLGWWRAHHPDLLLRHRGRLVADANWPDEVLLDIGTRAHRRVLARIVDRSFRVCERKGFDAVEPDNLDSWTRSRGLLQRADAVAYSRLLVRRAHARGLAIAQKNAVSLAQRRGVVGWDFAVAEECQVYRECDRFTAAYGGAVIEIEYHDAGGRANFTAACAARGAQIAIVYRDRDLVPAGRPGHVYDSC